MSIAPDGGWIPIFDPPTPLPVPTREPPTGTAPWPASPTPQPPRVPAPPAQDPTGDLVVVVAAGGGVGRSTTADLLARGLCLDGSVLLVDEAPGLFSPRRTFPRSSSGLAAAAGYGGSYWVLAPDSPASRVDAVAAVAASGDWGTVVVDTWDPVLYLLHTPRWHRMLTEYGVRVLLVTSSATGPLEHAVTAARALRQAGVQGQDLVAAVVDIGAGRTPRRALAKITLLDGECDALVRVPYLSSIRASGRLTEGQGGRAAERAATTIADRLALKEAA